MQPRKEHELPWLPPSRSSTYSFLPSPRRSGNQVMPPLPVSSSPFPALSPELISLSLTSGSQPPGGRTICCRAGRIRCCVGDDFDYPLPEPSVRLPHLRFPHLPAPRFPAGDAAPPPPAPARPEPAKDDSTAPSASGPSAVAVAVEPLDARAHRGRLKKLKILSGLKTVLSPDLLQLLQACGCRIRWVNKPLVYKDAI